MFFCQARRLVPSSRRFRCSAAADTRRVTSQVRCRHHYRRDRVFSGQRSSPLKLRRCGIPIKKKPVDCDRRLVDRARWYTQSATATVLETGSRLVLNYLSPRFRTIMTCIQIWACARACVCACQYLYKRRRRRDITECKIERTKRSLWTSRDLTSCPRGTVNKKHRRPRKVGAPGLSPPFGPFDGLSADANAEYVPQSAYYKKFSLRYPRRWKRNTRALLVLSKIL